MAKPKDYVAFPAVVCEYLRNLRDERARAQEQRRQAFKQRDQLRFAISKMDALDPKRMEKEAECWRIEERIRILGVSLSWLEDEKDRAIEEADQGKLWKSAEVTVPPELLAPKAPKDDDEDGEDESDEDDPDQETFDSRPIGEAGTPAPVKSDEPAPKRKRGRPRKQPAENKP